MEQQWTPQEINPLTDEDLIRTFAIQTGSAEQAQNTIRAYKLSGVIISDEDDTIFESDVTPSQLEQLRQDDEIINLSEI